MPRRKRKNKQNEVLRHLLELVIYADMYDFVLREDEIRKRWGISREIIDIAHAKGLLGKQQGRIFLPGRRNLIKKTKLAEKISDKKYEKAAEELSILKELPWVKMIALSGSIGAHNAKEDDDIDIFLVVEKNRQWIVRMFEYLYYGILLDKRNYPNKTNEKDKICINTYLITPPLIVPEKKRNLFTAYQSVLVEPIYGKDIYTCYLKTNTWIKKYFPYLRIKGLKTKRSRDCVENEPRNLILECINWALGIIQKAKIMLNNGNLTEILVDGNLFFHPKDPTKKTLAEFKKKRDVFFKHIDLT